MQICEILVLKIYVEIILPYYGWTNLISHVPLMGWEISWFLCTLK